jgi:hypothetical protein
MEECKIPAWAREKIFRHRQGTFSFPELHFQEECFILISFFYSVPEYTGRVIERYEELAHF